MFHSHRFVMLELQTDCMLHVLGDHMIPLQHPTLGLFKEQDLHLATYPNTSFTVIINPNSGPGGSTTLSDSNWVSALETLHTYPNAHLIGYVDTQFAGSTTDLTNAFADINTYANWPSSMSLNGIFFDDAPNTYSASSYSFMQNLTTTARSFSNLQTIFFNPGTFTDSEYFALADNIVVWENFYSDWDESTILANVPSTERSQSSIIVHDFLPESVSALSTLVEEIVGKGFAGVFCDDENEFE
ncbi:hypothetical protein G7Y89_g14614 [Cudoniella acicularis]|uniref:Uncharacterized protein n=1 Tax=Cudoniella acicularis TaxID=354080 RepID=A0A8H4QZ58_9HELO|nr:hypothetical protein G7Y89_g14614 [Cudoniella acicularis]